METAGLVVAVQPDVRPCLGRSCGGDALFLPPPGVSPDRPRIERGSVSVWAARAACASFWLLLTLLLLSPDPRALLGLEPWARWLPDPTVAHLVCFTLLAILAHLSRFPISRMALFAALFAYAIAAEALQTLVADRTAGLGDAAVNLAGLAVGTSVWFAGTRAALSFRGKMGIVRGATLEANTMYNVQRFRIVTVEGLLSHDTFIIAAERSAPAKPGCVVAINERDGAMITVHRDRLVPLEPVGPPILYHESRTACLKCGRVEGVVQDHVSCPYHGDLPCGLLEARKARVQLTHPMATH